MADVVTALSRAVKEAGHDAKVIIPKYDIINYGEVRSAAAHNRIPSARGCFPRSFVDSAVL